MIINEHLIQAIILVCSSASIWGMASKSSKYKRIGFTCGLCGQPFWIYTTFVSGQWGMFLVSLWFTGNHIRGLINHGRKKGE